MKFQIIDYRQENFGYIVIGPNARAEAVTNEAQTVLENEGFIDIDKYSLKNFEFDEFFHLRAPLIVFLEVTRKCNLRCKHCFISGGKSLEDELTLDEIIALLQELKKNKVILLNITGGEPFMREDIIDIIREAVKSVYHVQVVTNGTLITPEILEKIDKNVGFAISADGIKNSTAREISFEVLKEKFLILKNNGFNVQCWLCPTRQNIDEIYEICRWCLDHDILVFENVLLPLGRAKDNSELLFQESDYDKYMDEFRRCRLASIEYEQSGGATVPSSDTIFNLVFRFEAAVGMCKGGRSFAHIAANGDVYPCSNCEVIGLFKAGNIRDKKFMDIWHQSFTEIRKIKWSDFKGCKNCDIIEKAPHCKYRCPVLSKELYNDLTYCGATDFIKKMARGRLELKKEIEKIK